MVKAVRFNRAVAVRPSTSAVGSARPVCPKRCSLADEVTSEPRANHETIRFVFHWNKLAWNFPARLAEWHALVPVSWHIRSTIVLFCVPVDVSSQRIGFSFVATPGELLKRQLRSFFVSFGSIVVILLVETALSITGGAKMHNHPIPGLVGGKSQNPSAVTCPNCGHRLGLLRKEMQPRQRPANRLKRRARARSLLLVFRGALIWFAIVFVLVGVLAGAVGQSMLPTLLGIGLLAVYGFTFLFATR
jgi:endogenous inhibitor of DNA gyrase (YacG/DUF329 family)